MNDEWYDNYDGGVYTGSGSKGSKRKTVTRIPRFKSFIRKGHRGRRSRRGKVSDPETTIAIWVVITVLVSAFFHVELIFASLYALFVLYTLVTKDVWPIRYVSVVLTTMGILFFVAISLAVVVNLLIGSNILQDPATQVAYKYIIKVPLLSWSIVWLLENGIDWLHQRKYAKGNFVEKKKLLLQKIPKICLASSTVLLLVNVLHSVYALFHWGIWGLPMLSIINSWTTTFIIGLTILGKITQWRQAK